MAAAPIETHNLSRNFSKVQAVQEINLNIPSGQIYALIGPNGAGKTTLIKMLVGLIAPSSGQALICGEDIVKNPLGAKTNFGYVSDNPLVYDFLSGFEFLSLTGHLRGLKDPDLNSRITELSAIFPLGDILSRPMGSYSRGNRQKVAFLAANISHPKLLIVDEPVSGLDPVSITIFGENLRRFADGGGAVLMATHILSFAQTYAGQVGVMFEGKIRREESVTADSLEKIYQEVIPRL